MCVCVVERGDNTTIKNQLERSNVGSSWEMHVAPETSCYDLSALAEMLGEYANECRRRAREREQKSARNMERGNESQPGCLNATVGPLEMLKFEFSTAKVL
jgi:hypothetical protein